LEWREKQYDLRVRVDVFGRESSEVSVVKGALVYIASADHVKNLNYAGKISPVHANLIACECPSHALMELCCLEVPRWASAWTAF